MAGKMKANDFAVINRMKGISKVQKSPENAMICITNGKEVLRLPRNKAEQYFFEEIKTKKEEDVKAAIARGFRVVFEFDTVSTETKKRVSNEASKQLRRHIDGLSTPHKTEYFFEDEILSKVASGIGGVEAVLKHVLIFVPSQKWAFTNKTVYRQYRESLRPGSKIPAPKFSYEVETVDEKGNIIKKRIAKNIYR